MILHFSIFDSCHATVATLHPCPSTPPHCPLPYPQKKTFNPSFSKPAQVMCGIHYHHFPDGSGNYQAQVIHIVNTHKDILCSRNWVGVMDGGGWWWWSMSLSDVVGENEPCWGEESRCATLELSGIAVRTSHGWDAPIHSLLESCLYMWLPIKPNSRLAQPNLDFITATYSAVMKFSSLYVVWCSPPHS